MRTRTILAAVVAFLVAGALSAHAEVRHRKLNDWNFVTFVDNDAWQPEGFDEALILRTAFVAHPPTLDGRADDPVWARAQSLKVPLAYGKVREATLKAVYTEKEIFLLVSWPDPTKDDLHHPWVWNPNLGRYVEGPQVEDSLLVSIEAGCEWTPSLLSGYVYDFDGWRWLAARTDPVGQAVDTSGHVQDRWRAGMGYTKYQRRAQKPFWNLKFDARGPNIRTKPWQDLKRVYMFAPFQGAEIYVSMEPDGSRPPAFATRLPAPVVKPEVKKISQPLGSGPGQAALPLVPQFKPVKLTGDAGEVAAKGHWENGRWTVEFRRSLVTPARTATDSIFDRVTQFSIHIFDHTERVDESSESGRLFLQFEPAK